MVILAMPDMYQNLDSLIQVHQWSNHDLMQQYSVIYNPPNHEGLDSCLLHANEQYHAYFGIIFYHTLCVK